MQILNGLLSRDHVRELLTSSPRPSDLLYFSIDQRFVSNPLRLFLTFSAFVTFIYLKH